MKRFVWVASLGFAALLVHAASVRAQEQCPGDCNDDDETAINEIITCVNIALGTSPVSTCPACDVNGDGQVAINELIAAVNAALCGCPGCGTPPPTPTGGTPTPTATPGGFCGDGVENVEGETCDNGGVCVGGDNAGDTCTGPASCDSGDCRIVGGDGCAANCTEEDARVGVFNPAETIATVQTEAIPIIINLTGQQTFRTGKIRNTTVIGPGGQVLFQPGDMPVVLRAEEVLFDPVHVTGLVCACVRGVVVESFGPGVSATGTIGCGEQGLTDVNYRLIQDHNTNPGDRNNRIEGTPNDPECDDVNTLPGGTTSSACLEGSGELCSKPENEHTGICNGPRLLTRYGGQVPKGSAFILNNTAIGLLQDAGACSLAGAPPGRPCPYPDYGPDCQPCTDDDLELGDPENIPTTTGTAEAAVYDANNSLSNSHPAPTPILIDKDQLCFGIPCHTQETGKLFDCDALVANPTGGLSGGAIVVTFPSIDAKQIGDNVTGTIFSNQ